MPLHSHGLLLQLYFIDDDGNKQPAGSTVGSRTPEAPLSETWLIEPRQTLTDAGWDTLISLMNEIRIPGLGAPGQITDALLERIAQLSHLTYLDLRDSELTDTGLQHLTRLPQLQHLNLCCRRITDKGLDVLRHLPKLKAFELYHQGRVSDAGLANLSHCEHLERVNLMGTQTGDRVIEALTGKPRLRDSLQAPMSPTRASHCYTSFRCSRHGMAARL